MSKHQLSIISTGTGGRVELDGHDISSALMGINLCLDARNPTQATLDLAAFDVSTQAGAEVLIPDATRDLLVQLGWTPPADAEGGNA